jgi:predicted alpha/beta hydrolase
MGVTMAEHHVTIDAAGAPALQGRLFMPGGAPKAAVVLHGATGVPRDFYAPFARWLAEDRGLACLIYAYRGTEDTSPEAMRRSKVAMIDWGLHDQSAALSWLREHVPEAPLRVIGHSLGGFMTMMHADAGAVTRLTAVCSGPAYWRRAPAATRPRTFAFWHLLGPMGIALRGYLPGKALGLGQNMPAGVFRDWKRWCTNRDLHMPDWGGALPRPTQPPFAGRLTLVGVSDDEMIPPPVARDLARFYPDASGHEYREITPGAAGLRRVGHIGPFAPRAKAIWPLIAD